MKLELQAELLRRYPKFFRKSGKRLVDAEMGPDGEERLRDDMAPFDERGVECGDGWFALIDRVCRACEDEIDVLASQGVTKEHWPRVAQIKEKFGSLRLYIKGHVPDEVREEILPAARCESRRICAQCGTPRKPWQIGSPRTLCDSCEAKSAEAGMTDYQTQLREHARVLALLASRTE